MNVKAFRTFSALHPLQQNKQPMEVEATQLEPIAQQDLVL